MTRPVDRPAGSGNPASDPRILLALRTMPVMERQVFVLHARDRLDYAGIAVRLGLTVRDVEAHLARALAQYAVSWQRRHFDSESARASRRWVGQREQALAHQGV